MGSRIMVAAVAAPLMLLGKEIIEALPDSREAAVLAAVTLAVALLLFVLVRVLDGLQRQMHGDMSGEGFGRPRRRRRVSA